VGGVTRADTAGITDLSASIGGGPRGPFFDVQMHEASLQYFTYFARGEPKTLVTPTREEWLAFRQVLDTIDVFKWRKEYVDPRVLDGTSWSVRLVIDGRTVESEGSNKYPPGFERFRSALEALLGGQEFS
jgi:hypothetical protein